MEESCLHSRTSSLQMESSEDEAFHQQPNRSQFPSNSMQESILKIPVLPQELITEILSRLSVKPLLRFKSVSESWFALISSHEFIDTHLSISANNKDCTHHKFVLTNFVFISSHVNQYNLQSCSLSSLLNTDSESETETEAFDLDYPMNNPHNNVCVVGSVNGLICLAIGYANLFIWNPSIRKFKKLPDYRTRYRCCCFKYGFGYDESRDDYKVVCMFFCTYGFSCHVEVKIYSVKSDYWRNVDEDFLGGMQFTCLNMMRLTRTGKFVNGRICWANNDDCASRKVKNIVSIDLVDEKWGKVDQPCYGEGYNSLLMGVLGSDLSVFCNYLRSHTDVWVMKEYGINESWTKMYTIRYPENFFSCVSSAICMPNEGEILLMSGSNVIRYNPKDESIKYTEVANFRSSIAQDIYIESLVCPLLQTSAQQE